MALYSILYENIEEDFQKERAEQPEFFTDLNLDQIVNSITAEKRSYNLKPFF